MAIWKKYEIMTWCIYKAPWVEQWDVELKLKLMGGPWKKGTLLAFVTCWHFQYWHLSFQNLYENIKKEPFKIPEDDGNDLMHTFFNPVKEGWLMKQGEGYIFLTTTKLHVLVVSLVVSDPVVHFFT